jgi:hypothetical protein
MCPGQPRCGFGRLSWRLQGLICNGFEVLSRFKFIFINSSPTRKGHGIVELITRELVVSSGFEFVVSSPSGIGKTHWMVEVGICTAITRRNSGESATEHSMIA